MDKRAAAIGAAIVIIILLAQIVSYCIPRDASIRTSADGFDISYTVSSDYDALLTELHLENGFDVPDVCYVLYDEDYPGRKGEKGMLPTLYLMSQEAERFSGMELKTTTAGDLLERMESSLSTGVFDYSVAMVNGSIPDILYDGTASSVVIQWMSAGGVLYWSGEPFGRYVSDADGPHEVEDYESVCTSLFGSVLFNNSDEPVFAEEKLSPEFSDAVKILCNETTYGVDMSEAPAGSLFLGYTDGTYASAAIMKYGSGMMGVFGSPSGTQYTYYLVRAIAFGLTYMSQMASCYEMSVTGDDVSHSFQDDPAQSHFVMLHDLEPARIWEYDRSIGRFV